MKHNFKKILCVLLACLMVIPFCTEFAKLPQIWAASSDIVDIPDVNMKAALNSALNVEDSSADITKEQLDTLLSKQGNPYMKFIQVLEEVTGIEQSKIDKYVEDFRKSIGFTPEELESLKNEDIDKIVPMFAYASNPYVTRIAALALRNITRFVTTNFYYGKIEHVSSFDYRAFAGQRCEGAINTVIGFAEKNDEKAFLKIADGYSKNGSYSLGLESYDAVGDFVICIDGLFSSAVSTEDIEIEILPQFSYENQIAKGSAYVLPIYINGSEVSLYFAVDCEVTIGLMPVQERWLYRLAL